MRDELIKQIENLNDRIRWTQDDLQKAIQDFRRSITEYYPDTEIGKFRDNLVAESYYIVEFIPSKIKNIEELRNTIGKLQETKRCLEYILEENQNKKSKRI